MIDETATKDICTMYTSKNALERPAKDKEKSDKNNFEITANKIKFKIVINPEGKIFLLYVDPELTK